MKFLRIEDVKFRNLYRAKKMFERFYGQVKKPVPCTPKISNRNHLKKVDINRFEEECTRSSTTKEKNEDSEA